MSVAISVYAWRHRSIRSGGPFAIFMFLQAIYVLGYSMELASLNVPTMLFWSKIEYIGILTFPTCYLIFVIHYIDRERWLTWRTTLLLFVLPVIILYIKFNDDSFHLIYSAAALDTSGSIPLLAITRGPLYAIFVINNLAAVTLGSFLLWQKRNDFSPLYRGQTTIILSATAFIYLVYAIYLANIPLPTALNNLDFNPFVYTVWGLAISWAMFRFQLLNLTPIAREALIETLHDGVVVLDGQLRVVDANPAAQKIFNWSHPPVGQRAAQVFQNWKSLAVLEERSNTAATQTVSIEIEAASGDQRLYYDVDISRLTNQHSQDVGRLIVVSDMTRRKLAEDKLRELSLVDDLTGLNNRRGFYLLANQVLDMSRRIELPAALIYADMDGLKWVNDHMGHAEGDRALVDIAHILKATFRSSDIIARLGGDEFAILMIESNGDSGESSLVRLFEQIKTHNSQPEQLYPLSFSIGMAYYEPKQSVSIDTLLKTADKAMYEQKQNKKKAF